MSGSAITQSSGDLNLTRCERNRTCQSSSCVHHQQALLESVSGTSSTYSYRCNLELNVIGGCKLNDDPKDPREQERRLWRVDLVINITAMTICYLVIWYTAMKKPCHSVSQGQLSQDNVFETASGHLVHQLKLPTGSTSC